MRPMWNEFPDQAKMWTVSTQFMLGGSILVAPKLTEPTFQDMLSHTQQVSYILPEEELWYNYYTKELASSTGSHQTVTLPDLEQAVFIRGGSILPILLHEECLALLKCYKNPIRLEMYLDEAQEAAGQLYIDDGLSYEYQDGAYAKIQFDYQDSLLTSERIEGAQDVLEPS